jgi:hypothetical protein
VVPPNTALLMTVTLYKDRYICHTQLRRFARMTLILVHGSDHPDATLTEACKHSAAPRVARVNITVAGPARWLCLEHRWQTKALWCAGSSSTRIGNRVR